MNVIAAILAAIVVGTWNGKWFPSGRADHRAEKAVEDRTIAAAGGMLRDALATVDPAGTNDVILCLNEIRDVAAASNLVEAIGRAGMKIASISRYRRRDRFDMQQDVIATTLPVASSGWCKWRNSREYTPPRGYAFASLVVRPSVTAHVYAVHLKSNYGANTESKMAMNRSKRTIAAKELVAASSKRRNGDGQRVIIAGDLNADCWSDRFAEESLFKILEEAGFTNLLAMVPAARRGTHPSGKWGVSTLDYIMARGFDAERAPWIFPNDGLSDHWAVFAVLNDL